MNHCLEISSYGYCLLKLRTIWCEIIHLTLRKSIFVDTVKQTVCELLQSIVVAVFHTIQTQLQALRLVQFRVPGTIYGSMLEANKF